jgi:predicted membrane-bound spermidine synthase
LDRRYLYFAVFASGMTSLAVELSASRLLGPAFGVSNIVWASIIGLILIYLTLGYFIGGRWADRSPYPRTLYTLLAWAGFTTGLVPLVARPVLTWAADAFDQLQVAALLGSFATVLVLFIIPVTLLGTISPFAIRLAIDDPTHAGVISGRIYAISTLGSFVGTFLPVLVLTPTIGTTYTFTTFALFLTLVAIIGLWHSCGWRCALPWLWMLPALLILAFYLGRGALKDTQGQIYEKESAYNYIQVLERDGYRYLRLNEGQGIHSEWNATQLNYSGPWEQFLPAPFFNKPPYPIENVKSMAIIGLAAGTVARQATAVFGSIPIDGFEIDPEIIAAGRKYFDMNETNLAAIAQDGRYGLEHSSHKYSIIAVDAYRPPYIPWHLTTREFFRAAYNHLSPDGVLVINVGRSPNDRSLINGLASTIHTVFPSIYIMDVPGSFNSMIYATVQTTDVTYLYQNISQIIQKGGAHPLLLEALALTVVNLKPTPTNTVVYTDDWAPIELITNNMVMNFILFGDMGQIGK